MLESIFIMMMSMGFVLFILAVYDESIIFAATSLLMWIMTLAGSVYIQVPGSGDSYNEMGIVGIALAFIFMNILWLVIQFLNYQKVNRLP